MAYKVWSDQSPLKVSLVSFFSLLSFKYLEHKRAIIWDFAWEWQFVIAISMYKAIASLHKKVSLFIV